jgi:hypothetical protein
MSINPQGKLASTYEISPCDNIDGTHKQGELRNITAWEIVDLLGFKPNIKDDPTKVVHSWAFKVRPVGSDNQPVLVAIWDYKGSHKAEIFSTYGPDGLLEPMFFGHYHRPMWA